MRLMVLFRAAVLLPIVGFAMAVCGAANAEISQVAIVTRQFATNGTPNGLGFQQQFDVEAGDGINSMSMTTPSGVTYLLQHDVSSNFWQYNSPNYAGLSSLQQDFGTGNYTLSVQYSGAIDTATLPFGPAQTGTFIQPTYPAVNATNVPYDTAPTFTWSSGVLGMNCMFDYELSYADGRTVDMGGPVLGNTTSWTPSAILTPGTQYDFVLSLYTGAAVPGQQTQSGDSFQYYGVNGYVNSVPFRTAAPEPGVLALLAVGVAAMAWWRAVRRK